MRKNSCQLKQGNSSLAAIQRAFWEEKKMNYFEEVITIFQRNKAIITGDHFVYAKKAGGWYHGPDYVNKDAIFPNPRDVRILCRYLANHFLYDDIEVVVGPTVGGVSLAQYVALQMNEFFPKREILAVYADEEDVVGNFNLNKGDIRNQRPILKFMASGEVEITMSAVYCSIKRIEYCAKVGTKRILKRGYDKIVAGKRCLITEDVINSGATVEKVKEAILKAGGKVIGVAALCNRSRGLVGACSLRVQKFYSLVNMGLVMYPEDECPICKDRGPESVRVDLGKGKEFLIRKGLIHTAWSNRLFAI